jgi:hypothetical protein
MENKNIGMHKTQGSWNPLSFELDRFSLL